MKNNSKPWRLPFAISLLSVLTSSPVISGGFYLSEIGTPASLGTAGVGNSVNTEGADTAWANPANMTYIDQPQTLGGMQVVLSKVEFDVQSSSVSGDDGGNAGVPALAPSFFYVRPIDEDLRFGFAIAGAMGGGYDYGSSFVGRYTAKEVELIGLGFTPSIGYRVNDRLSLGAGVSIVKTLFNQSLAINNGPATPQTDGEAKFDDMEDWGYQGIFSLSYKLSDQMLLGMVYRTEMDTDLEGDLILKNAGPLGNRKADLNIEWTNPQWIDVALRYDYSDDTQFAINVGWQEWSKFDDNFVTINTSTPLNPTVVLERNWDDIWYFGAAVAHQLDDRSAVLLGMMYEESVVDDQYRTTDLALDETWKFSGAYAWKADKFDYSLAATLMVMGDADIDQTFQGVRVVGDYDTNAILFLGGTLKYDF